MSVSLTISKNYFEDVNEVRSTFYLPAEMKDRVTYLKAIPCSIAANLIDMTAGLFWGTVNLLSGGTQEGIRQKASHNLDAFQNIVAQPFQFTIGLLHPKALHLWKNETLWDDYLKSMFLSGFFFDWVDPHIYGIAFELARSENFFKREIATRLTHALRLLVAVITRTADAIIGVITGIFAILTLGRFDLINKVAYRALQAPALISDVFNIGKCIVYPYIS